MTLIKRLYVPELVFRTTGFSSVRKTLSTGALRRNLSRAVALARSGKLPVWENSITTAPLRTKETNGGFRVQPSEGQTSRAGQIAQMDFAQPPKPCNHREERSMWIACCFTKAGSCLAARWPRTISHQKSFFTPDHASDFEHPRGTLIEHTLGFETPFIGPLWAFTQHQVNNFKMTLDSQGELNIVDCVVSLFVLLLRV